MEILILLLISPAVFAQRYRKPSNPNDEPFLPIHPVYPYSPKLTKRGSDKEIGTIFKPELYAPRTDARDSYTSSYAEGPKDSYFPDDYGSYPRGPVAPYSSPYSPYYGNALYGPYGSPSYSAGPYPDNQYASGVHGSAPYPGYYSQSPYFYPDYYNRPFPYSYPDYLGPPGPPAGPPRSEPSSFGEENGAEEQEDKPKSGKTKIDEIPSSPTNDGAVSQYVDGNNLISQSYKDLGAHPSVQKTADPYNRIEQISDVHLKNIPLPQPTYKVISVGGHPVGPDYPIPSSYARAQILEQVAAMRNLVAKSLGQRFSNSGSQNSASTPSHLPYVGAVGLLQNSSGKPGEEDPYPPGSSPVGTSREAGRYHSETLNPRGKSIEPHVYGSNSHDLPEKESARFLSDIYNSDKNGASGAEYLADQGTRETFSKAPSKYQNLPSYAQKQQQAVTRVTLEQSRGTYIAPEKASPSTSLGDPADQSSGTRRDQPPVAPTIPLRHEANSFRPDETPGVVSYQNQNNRHSMPQAFTYHFANVRPYASGMQQQSKTNLEDVNFGTKQGNKG